MKKVILYAYTKSNLGDDLFIRTITSRYKNVQFLMWSDESNNLPDFRIGNLKVIRLNQGIFSKLKVIKPSLVACLRDLIEKSCSAIVYIGGSIFIEYDNWEQILTWWEYEAVHRKFYVLGANFGPYSTEAYRKQHAQLFSKMQDVCFRDQYSQTLFSEIKTVRCAPDILFSYKMPTVDVNEKNIFVSLIDCQLKKEGINDLSKYSACYVEHMVALLSFFLEHDCTITFASFCSYEGDEDGIFKVLEKIDVPEQKNRIRIVSYNGQNIDEVTSAISQSEFVIASRFHASILGFTAGKPVLPIVYSDKTINVLKDIGFKGKYLDIRKMNENSCDFVVNDVEEQKIKDILSLRRSSYVHFEKLDKLLGKNEV